MANLHPCKHFFRLGDVSLGKFSLHMMCKRHVMLRNFIMPNHALPFQHAMSCHVLFHAMPCHAMLCVISWHAVSCHVVSCVASSHAVLCHVMCSFMPCPVMSCNVMLFQVLPCYVMSCLISSHDMLSCQVMLRHVKLRSCHVMCDVMMIHESLADAMSCYAIPLLCHFIMPCHVKPCYVIACLHSCHVMPRHSTQIASSQASSCHVMIHESHLGLGMLPHCHRREDQYVCRLSGVQVPSGNDFIYTQEPS